MEEAQICYPHIIKGLYIMTTQNTTIATLSTEQKAIVTAIRSSVKNGVKIATGLNAFIQADDVQSVQGIITEFYNEKEAHRVTNDKTNKALKNKITTALTKAGKLTGKELKAAISTQYNSEKSKAECKNWDAARKAVVRAYALVDIKATLKDGLLEFGAMAPAAAPADETAPAAASESGLMDTAQTFDKISALIADLETVGAMAELKSLQAVLASAVDAVAKQRTKAA